MATVHLAYDLKHDRRVAVKVLRPELAAVLGAERFVTEIRTTASLQHPHILPLFDSGTADGFLYYVMPFVDGETLRAKLDRERQLGIDEAVRLAGAVADALDYAHRHGVIHRDIKPENILLHEGRPVVADFGIALAVSAAAGGRITETGLSLGTPHYMSPEQATAEKDITARSDIYSLASVLYELLAGDPPHTGASAQQVIAKIIAEETPPVSKFRRAVPPNVSAAIGKALEKLPADRFASAREFAAALADPHFAETRDAGGASRRYRRDRVRAPTLVAAGVVAVLAGVIGWVGRGWAGAPPRPAPIRFTTTLGKPGVDPMQLAISADGRRILQSSFDEAGRFRVLMRDLGRDTVFPIPGTEGGSGAVFSPDGESVAFVVLGSLRRVALRGGPATRLLDTMDVHLMGLAWTPDDRIIFSVRHRGLWSIAATGGTPVQLTRVDTARGEFAHWAPHVLPGGRAFIYTIYASPVNRSSIAAYDFGSGRSTVLAANAFSGGYAASGHLLYGLDGAVFAVPFDPKRLATRGSAVPVQGDVTWSATTGQAGYAVSPNGTFAYLRDSEWFSDRALVWRSRTGKDSAAIERPGAYSEPRLSPDGRWIALTVTKPKSDLWLYEIGRRALTRLTRAPALAFNAAWLPDSRQLAYTFEDRTYEMHVVPIDASSADRVLLSSPSDEYVSSVSGDGRHVLFTEHGRNIQVMIAPVDGSTPPRPLAPSPLPQRTAVFSPDGRWVAYSEFGESGAEIHLRAASGGGGRRVISAGGGIQPRWTKGGREIVYVRGSSMMSVTIDPATGEAGIPVALFPVDDLEVDALGWRHNYDVTPNGEQFLVVKRIERPEARPLVVTLNWSPDRTAAERETE